ncbi:hypothetical protein KM043_010126 [Ampulex compressa]|nr:hypothetical protein KM043_010126 [Ampulex compressa]
MGPASSREQIGEQIGDDDGLQINPKPTIIANNIHQKARARLPWKNRLVRVGLVDANGPGGQERVILVDDVRDSGGWVRVFLIVVPGGINDTNGLNRGNGADALFARPLSRERTRSLPLLRTFSSAPPRSTYPAPILAVGCGPADTRWQCDRG